MTALEPVIGLEIHVQLATETKMFCGCRLSFGDEPNSHICPVCLGHPGVLPNVNEQAIVYALMIGEALGCEIAERSTFHRKNYFYPDLPKGYQISQYDHPIAVDGRLGDVRVHRAHLEEDAAKLSHKGASGRIHGSGASVVDFNRGGTPLVEIVSEPDIRSAAQAREWAQLLRATLASLGVSDCNMEEGSLRVDGNVSLRPAGSDELGTKTELKNMNSFRFLERGIEAEIQRQRELIESGQEVQQETLHFHPDDGSLTPMRSKEYAHDYRYFPEPDLVPVVPTAEMREAARAALPELPAARKERYLTELDLPEATAASLAFQPELGGFFEDALGAGSEATPRAIANWVTGDLVAALREQDLGEDPSRSKAEPGEIAALAAMVEGKQVSHSAGKQILGKLTSEGGTAAGLVESEGLAQISDDSEIDAMIDAAIESEPEAADQVRSGNEKAIGRIVGAAMKNSQGRIDGGLAREKILERLG